MSNSPDTIRNYQPADFNKFVQLYSDAEKLEPAGRFISPQGIAENLGRPNYSPEHDLFVVETAGNIIGYLDITSNLDIRRVILDCWVHPEYRRKGLGSKLVGYAIHRAKELGAKVVHVNIARENSVAQNALSKLGFECVRRFLELRLDMTEVRWADIDRAALEYRLMQPGEEDQLTLIQNRSFAGTWGYNPNTVEEITYLINSSNYSPQDVIFTCEGDKVVGYCWTGITGRGEAGTDPGKGRLLMLGVDPDYRDRGVGERVLLSGLAHLKDKGLRVVELTVDSENKAACDLYRALGFAVETSSLWYEKVID